jgi:UDPglucose 6-dehydrogenase
MLTICCCWQLVCFACALQRHCYYTAPFVDAGAKLAIYDPKVKKAQMIKDLKAVSRDDPDRVDRLVTFCDEPYTAMDGAHAVAVLTEWQEFRDYDFEKVYATMPKPAYVFDGRSIMDHAKLQAIGFKVEAIGKVCNKGGRPSSSLLVPSSP